MFLRMVDKYGAWEVLGSQKKCQRWSHGDQFYHSLQLGRFRTYIPTSNLVRIKEVAIRTTFSHIINIAGIIYYTRNYCHSIYPL